MTCLHFVLCSRCKIPHSGSSSLLSVVVGGRELGVLCTGCSVAIRELIQADLSWTAIPEVLLAYLKPEGA